MAFTPLCLSLAASLIIQPDRRQFFRYEAFTLSCEISGNFSGWMVMRNASENISPCEKWGKSNRTSCTNQSTYKSDSGLYWCQSEQGECSNVLNITISTHVILESPALPVTIQDSVTLGCSFKEERYAQDSSSDFLADFYVNDTFIGSENKGKMILQNVTMSSKGFYKCKHPIRGHSVESWLEVKAPTEKPELGSTSPPPLMTTSSLLCTIVLFILYTIIFIMCTIIYRRWARARADAKRREY